MAEKKLCSIHRLYYYGTECPLCFQERINRYDKKFGKKEEEKVITNEEPSAESIEKLIEKFNKKK